MLKFIYDKTDIVHDKVIEGNNVLMIFFDMALLIYI